MAAEPVTVAVAVVAAAPWQCLGSATQWETQVTQDAVESGFTRLNLEGRLRFLDKKTQTKKKQKGYNKAFFLALKMM